MSSPPRAATTENRSPPVRNAVLDGAELLELGMRVGRQQLRQHPGHRLEVQPMRGNVDRRDVPTTRYGPLTDVHHQRVAVGANNCGQ